MREVNKIRGMSINEPISLGITQTNIEIQDIIKVIEFFEYRGILLKKTTRKIISQKRELRNFLRPLMSVGLLLVKNILTPLAKIVLLVLGLTKAASATDAAVQKKFFGLDN